MAMRICALVFLLLSFAGNTFALGTLIPANNRIDMAHDSARDVVYISNNDSILRYQISTASFLTPYVLGGQLLGVDISPDGNWLAVADQVQSGSELWVHLIDLRTDTAIKLSAPLAFMEGGTFAVAFDANGGLVVSSSFQGSGWTPLRRFDLVTGQASILASVRQDSMLSASGDRTVIAIAESNISDGRFDRYTVATGQFDQRQGYSNGTGWFNYEIGANRDGSQLAIPTYGGAFFYDQTFAKIQSVGQYAGPQPIGVAYHPVENLIFLPWASTTLVKVLDTTTFVEIGSYDFQDVFGTNGNRAFVGGRTKLSGDGSLLMVTVSGGVRIHRLYAPLNVTSVAVSTPAGTPISLILGGSVGNNGTLTYAVSQNPTNGNATIDGASAIYTPNPGFVGTDTFRYRALYGRAWADADVTITVTPINHAPIASDLMVATSEDVPVAIALQASDPDGDPLSYFIASLPSHGTLSGSGSTWVYAPAPNYNGPDSFTFQAGDGRLTSNIATVSVNVAAVNDAPVAQADAALTKRNVSVAIPALANDTDVDGDILHIVKVSAPRHGTAMISGTTVIYKPQKNYVGDDRFSYTISDGNGGVASAAIAVTITPK